MPLFDRKFRANKLRYCLQTGLAGLAMLIILAYLKSISNAAVIASLGASTFIVFVLPQTQSSRARFLIGGYVVGIVVGSGCYWLSRIVQLPDQIGLVTEIPAVVFGAAAVALATFLMVVTNTEHPPAAGVALGFVLLEQWHWSVPVAVLIGIVVLSLVKHVLRNSLHNLL